MAAQREPAAALEEGELGSGVGAALEGDAAPAAVEVDPVDERVVAGRRGVRCSEVAGAAVPFQRDALVDEAQRDPVRLERLEPEVARAAVLGVAQAPVAPAVGLAQQMDLAVAQDHPRDQPAAVVALPGELEHRLAEHGERPARIGPGRIGDAHAVERDLGRERVGEAEAHPVEVDLASRGLAQVGAERMRQPPRMRHDHGDEEDHQPESDDEPGAKRTRAAARRGHRRRECRLLAETTDIEDSLHEQQPRANAGPDRQRPGRRRPSPGAIRRSHRRTRASPIRSASRCPTSSPARSKAIRSRRRSPRRSRRSKS